MTKHLRVLKLGDSFQIVEDNRPHEELNTYDLAFAKGYELAKNGKSEEEAIQLAVTSDPQELKGLRDGWANYHTSYTPSIPMSDSRRQLKDAVLEYGGNPSKENFFRVLDAKENLDNSQTESFEDEEGNGIASDGEDFYFFKSFSNLEEAQKYLADNPDMEIKTTDPENHTVQIGQKVKDAFYKVEDADSDEYSIKKVNNKHYEVLKNGEHAYDLEQKQSNWTCSCPGFKYRGRCRHLGLLQDVLPKRHPRAELEALEPEIEKMFSVFGPRYDESTGQGRWEIVGSYRRGKCFRAGTLVKTIRGLRPIEEINVGDLVFNGYGNLTEVTKVFKEEQKDWCRVGVGRDRWINCTPYHKFLVWKSNSPRKDFEWVPAVDLNKSSHWKLVSPLITLPQEISVGKDRAFLLGWYLADGNLFWVENKENYSPRVKYKNGGFYHVNFAANCKRSKQLLHLIAELGLCDFSFRRNSTENNALEINVRDTDLINFILKWGGFHGDGHEKTPSWDILNLVKEEKVEFLRGFWLGDGTFGKYRDSASCRFFNTNRDIIEIVDLLLSEDYRTLRYTRTPKEGSNEKLDYEVRLSGMNAVDFVKSMPDFLVESKYTDGRIKEQVWKVKKQMTAVPVSSRCVELYEEPSVRYCFEVADGESFIADGVSVHNSTFKDIDVLVECSKPEFAKVEEILQQDPEYKKVMAGPDIVRGYYHGYEFDVSRVEPGEWGSYLLYRTGSANENLRMRGVAKSKGWRLNEHGLWDENGKLITNKSEKDIYKALGMRYKSPKERE